VPLSTAQDHPVWINGGIFHLAAIFVWSAGTRLTRYLDDLARMMGWGQSSSACCFWTGNPALAVNNLLGSAAINVLLLAVTDAFIGREAATSAVARPVTLMMATLCMLVLTAVAIAITITDVLVLGVGIWSIALCVISIGSFWLSIGYNDRAS
jgi:cation:H+ antiporter